MMTLYTPGHHEVTDTLIMYGLVKVIKAAEPLAEVKIRNLGTSYEISCSDNVDLNRVIDVIKLELEKIVRIMKSESEIGARLKNLKKQKIKAPQELTSTFSILHQKSLAALDPTPINSKRIMENVERLYRDIDYNKIFESYFYQSEVHFGNKKKCGIRKTQAKGGSLVILPIGGNLQAGNLQLRYNLCESCQALSWIGMYNFAIRMIHQNKSTIGILTFEDQANDVDVLLLKNFAEIVDIGEYWGDIPLKAIPMLIFSIGETPLAFSTLNWKFVGYILSGEGRVAAIRSYESFKINNLIRFFEKAKIYSYNVTRIVDMLRKNNDGIQALSVFSEAIIYKDIDLVYRAIRSMNNILRSKQNLLDDGIIKAAFEVCY